MSFCYYEHSREHKLCPYRVGIVNTVETGYNIVGSRKTCSYNRYVLITGVLITGFHCTTIVEGYICSRLILTFLWCSFSEVLLELVS